LNYNGVSRKLTQSNLENQSIKEKKVLGGLNLNFRNKKGGVNAIFFIAVIVILLIVWGAVSLIGNSILKEINVDFQNDTNSDAFAKANLQQTTTNYPKTMDSSYLVIMLLAWIGVVIASFNALEHPIFFIIAIIFVSALLFIGAVLSNFYEDLANSSDLVLSAADFPITYFVNSQMVLVVLVIVASVIITMYARERL